jgi:alpha-methylacyl-CoA racemase
VLWGVEQHFGLALGKLGPAVLKPTSVIGFGCFHASRAKRASGRGEIGPFLSVGINDDDVPGEYIDPGNRLWRVVVGARIVSAKRWGTLLVHHTTAFHANAPRTVHLTTCFGPLWECILARLEVLGSATDDRDMSGPLTGLTVIELAGIGPGPFAGMLLSDMGATVIRVERAQEVRGGDPDAPPKDILRRGRHSIGVDLKNPAGVEVVLRLVEKADALFEGFRPGVTERLGLGPEVCLTRNPRLAYGRMTGWGQTGPYALAAGHDINYIALAGALEPIGRAGQGPTPPLNLVGDFGGGGMFLAFGLVCAMLEAKTSGKGQVVDAAMVDGAATLMSMFHSFAAMGVHKPERGTNMLDTGAPFYDVYECADGKYVSIGSIEPQFYAELRKLADLSDPIWDPQVDQENWPAKKVKMGEVFKTKTRDEWCAIMEHTDVCFAPVLSLVEAPKHPHNVARGTFQALGGVVQPSPAPRFSRTVPEIAGPPSHAGAETNSLLTTMGFSADEIASLQEAGAIR